MIDAIKSFFAHSRTIAVARLYSLAGVAVATYDAYGAFFSGADYTPLYTRVLDHAGVPQDFRPLVVSGVVGATGVLFEKMRRITTTPIGGPNASVPPPAS